MKLVNYLINGLCAFVRIVLYTICALPVVSVVLFIAYLAQPIISHEFDDSLALTLVLAAEAISMLFVSAILIKMARTASGGFNYWAEQAKRYLATA